MSTGRRELASPAQGDRPRVLSVANFAHIRSANIRLGDQTVLVGPQATGKSLILELFKLALDGQVIAKTMDRYGLVFRDEKQFLARYLGEGMERAWMTNTKVLWRGKRVDIGQIASHPRKGHHSVYFVPAHRTLILSEGYPPTFQQFRPETPFVVRHFSEEVASGKVFIRPTHPQFRVLRVSGIQGPIRTLELGPT